MTRVSIPPDGYDRLISIAASAAQALRIGRYSIVREIGRGGMGIVYEAIDPQLNRPVALKLVRAEARAGHLDPRFRREAEIVAKLRHPGIVAVHEFGTASDGASHFMVMDYVEGRTMEDLLRERPVELRTLVRLLEEAARAVAHAHSEGVVHRDLKPSNILVDAKGRAMLTDFGLAHAEGFDRLTATAAALGTPAYMAPEQVSARPGQLTPRTDVYGLGAILYEILCGRPPHLAPTLAATYLQILAQDPVPPRRTAPSAPPELEAVCLRALEKNPAHRYATAGAFADELSRWLAGAPVEAKPLSAIARARRSLARHRTAFLSLCAGVLVAAAATGWIVSESLARAGRAEELLKSAQRSEAAGELDAALDAYARLLAIDRESVAGRTGHDRVRGKREQRMLAREDVARRFEAARPLLERAQSMLYRESFDYNEFATQLAPAQSMIEAGVEKEPELAVGHMLLGRAQFLDGRIDRAEASLRRALSLDPALAAARSLLGLVLIERGVSMGLVVEPEARRGRFLQSIERMIADLLREPAPGAGPDERREHLAARALLEWARENHPHVLRLREQARGEFGRAPGTEVFDVLAGIRPDGSTDLEPLETALRIRPHYALALTARGAHLGGDAGRRDEALRDYSHAIDVSPNTYWTHLARGCFSGERGEVAGAMRDLDAAVRLAPGDAFSLRMRGIARVALKDYANALLDLEASLQSGPGSASTWFARGRLRLLLGEPAQARADLDRAIDLRPRFADALAARADVRAKDGDRAGAIEDLRLALECAPPRWPGRAQAEERLRAVEGPEKR